MPNGLEPKPSIPIPGTPQTWTQGIIAVAVMALLGHQGVNMSTVTGNQEESEKAVEMVIEKIDAVTTDAEKTRRDLIRQMKLGLEKQEEILAAIKRLEGANE